MDDDLFDLPDGWEWTTIGAISNYVQRGKSPKYTESSDLPVINQKCIRWNGIEIQHLKFIHPDQWLQWNEERFIKEGDILWNSTGTGTIGRAAIYKHLPEFQRIVADSHVTIVRAAHCSSDFLHYWIMSPFIQSRIDDMQSGSTNQVELSRVEVLKTLVPLPPINEQKRIVEKIESLRARSRAARKSIESIPTLIKQFRQSVLAAAFNGDLTKEWRENNSDVESAEVLLSRISGKFDPNSLNVKEIEFDASYNIPDTWIWTRLKSFVQNIEAGKSFLCPEIPVEKNTVGLVKISAVTWGKFNFEETKTVSDRTKIDSRLFIQDDDFLISRANTLELVGASVIVDRIEHRIMLSDKVWRVNFIEVNKRYVNFYLKSELGRKEIESRATGNQLSMRNISQNNFKDIKIPLSSIAEQKAIVSIIEYLFSHIDRIEAQYKEIVQEIDRLDRSILHQAFTGRLVAQDADDEPAKILLERIQIDRDRTKNKVNS